MEHVRIVKTIQEHKGMVNSVVLMNVEIDKCLSMMELVKTAKITKENKEN